jgi:hypothetical protein
MSGQFAHDFTNHSTSGVVDNTTAGIIFKDPWNQYNIKDATTVTYTGDTGTSDLKSVTITQDTLGANDTIFVTAGGKKTGANDDKTSYISIGGTNYAVTAAANNTNDWKVDFSVQLKNSTTVEIGWVGWDGATPLQGHEEKTISDFTSNDLVIKTRANLQHADDSVTQEYFIMHRK